MVYVESQLQPASQQNGARAESPSCLGQANSAELIRKYVQGKVVQAAGSNDS